MILISPISKVDVIPTVQLSTPLQAKEDCAKWIGLPYQVREYNWALWQFGNDEGTLQDGMKYTSMNTLCLC